MITALFADIHSNLTALEACLRHARQRGAERFVFLGDLVGYGPDPAEVLDVITALNGAIVVKGNHDEAIQVEPRTRDLGEVASAVSRGARGLRPRIRQATGEMGVRSGLGRCPREHGRGRRGPRVLWACARAIALFQ